MTKQREPPVRFGASDRELVRAEILLTNAERSIRLLDRLVPKNWAEERARLSARLEREEALEPALVYERSAMELGPLRQELLLLADEFDALDEHYRLFAERARELALEAELAESIGAPKFRVLAAARYATRDDDEVTALAASWLDAQEDSLQTELVRADDERDPRSLVRVLGREIGKLKLPVRIELRAGLASVAAAGEGFVAVQPSARLRPLEAERIVRHELGAHVLPRVCAESERLGIFRVGSAGASEAEEGRALLLEERAGFLDARRKRTLALRHRAAVAVADGAELGEVVRSLVAQGVDSDAALDLGLRVTRGGGLARERVYLGAFVRVARAFAREPRLERFFERGRVSLEAARVIDTIERGASEAPSGRR